MAAESATAPPSAVGEGGGGEDLDVSTQILREQARERSDVIRTDIERLFRDIRAYNDGEEMPVRRTEKQLLETIAEALARAIADGAMAAEVAPKSLGFFKCIIGRNIEAAMEDAIPGEFNCDQKTRRSGNVPDLRVRWAEDFGAETKAVCINDGVVADKIGKMLFAHVITLAVSHLRTQRIVADRIEDWPVANVDPSHHGTQAAPEKSGGAARPPKSGKNFDGCLEMRDGTTFLVECKTRMRDNPIYDSYQIQAGGGKTMGRGDGWFCVLWNSCVTSETKFKDARDMLAAIERIAFVETAEFGKLKHKGKETCRLCVKKFTLAEGRIEKNRIKQLHVVTGAEGVVPKNKKMFAEKIDYTDPNILTEAGARICAWAATEAAARVIHEAAEAARTTKGV